MMIAAAEARLPSTVATAPAAEAWALWFVTTLCRFMPPVVTDCIALLRTAEGGAAAATAAARPLVGVWVRIASALDGDLTPLAAGGRLVWMPAHQSAATAARSLRSDGAAVSTHDLAGQQVRRRHRQVRGG